MNAPTGWPPRAAGRHRTGTLGNSEVGNSEFPGAPRLVPGPREHAEDSEIGPDSEITDGEQGSGFSWAALAGSWVVRGRRIGVWATALFRPPTVWVDPPASISALIAYAGQGAWTGHDGGPRRAAGVWWCRLVAIPFTVAAYYAAWFVQRPGRFFTLLGLYALLAQTTPDRFLMPWPDALTWPFPWLTWPF